MPRLLPGESTLQKSEDDDATSSSAAKKEQDTSPAPAAALTAVPTGPCVGIKLSLSVVIFGASGDLAKKKARVPISFAGSRRACNVASSHHKSMRYILTFLHYRAGATRAGISLPGSKASLRHSLLRCRTQ